MTKQIFSPKRKEGFRERTEHQTYLLTQLLECRTMLDEMHIEECRKQYDANKYIFFTVSSVIFVVSLFVSSLIGMLGMLVWACYISSYDVYFYDYRFDNGDVICKMIPGDTGGEKMLLLFFLWPLGLFFLLLLIVKEALTIPAKICWHFGFDFFYIMKLYGKRFMPNNYQIAYHPTYLPLLSREQYFSGPIPKYSILDYYEDRVPERLLNSNKPRFLDRLVDAYSPALNTAVKQG